MTDAKTICESELPYTWNSIIFNAAGDTTVTLQTVNGCDSVVTMTLIVNPTYTMTDAKTICESELPYIWNSITFDAAGDTTVTLQTINGCDSVVTMTLSVNPIYNDTTAVAICASELPYTWNGVTFTEAGTQTTTLQTVNGCDSIVTMTLAVNPTYAVTDVQAICESELPYTWNGVSFDAAGTQTAMLQTVYGCDSVVTMILTVNPTFSVTDTKTICQSELPYTWNGVIFAAADTQNVILSTVNDCDSVVTMTLIVNPIYNMTDSVVICHGDSYNFFGQMLTQSGVYSHTLQSMNGCDSTIILHLHIHNPVHTAVTIEECGSYTWVAGGNQTYTTSGDYTYSHADAYGCAQVDTLHLTIYPTYNISISEEICQGTVYPFFGDMLNQPGIYTHTLQSVNGCDSVIVLNLTVYPTHYSSLAGTICEGETYFFFGNPLSQPGDYNYVLQGVHGCDSIVTLHLTINDTMATKEIVCKKHANGVPYMLVYPEAGLLYQWYKDDVPIDAATQQYYAPVGGLLPGACYQVHVARNLGACGALTDCWKNTSSKTEKVRVLPNPNDGQFRLMIPEGTVNVQILNVNGQVVMTRKVDGDEVLEMNTGLANGLYFVKTFRADGSFNTEKLVINR